MTEDMQGWRRGRLSARVGYPTEYCAESREDRRSEEGRREGQGGLLPRTISGINQQRESDHEIKQSIKMEGQGGGALLVAVATIGAGGALVGLTGAASSASTGGPQDDSQDGTVTLQFWNAYNDVTETPVMNGVVIPELRVSEPRHQGVDDTLPYAGHAAEVHRIVCRGGPTGPDAF